jgi:hypothetical protein
MRQQGSLADSSRKKSDGPAGNEISWNMRWQRITWEAALGILCDIPGFLSVASSQHSLGKRYKKHLIPS